MDREALKRKGEREENRGGENVRDGGWKWHKERGSEVVVLLRWRSLVQACFRCLGAAWGRYVEGVLCQRDEAIKSSGSRERYGYELALG